MTFPKPAILEQEMDRKEFLKNIGIAMLLLAGGSMIINALTGLDTLRGAKQVSHTSRSYGYGSSRYGV